jgi:hypothetical protein
MWREGGWPRPRASFIINRVSQVSLPQSPEPIRGLAGEEFDSATRHIGGGAQIPRWTPETAPIVAFERHLKEDLSGYPENIGGRTPNLCTMNLSIADAFVALRRNGDTWDRDDRGEHPYAVVEAVDPESVDIDPLEYL